MNPQQAAQTHLPDLPSDLLQAALDQAESLNPLVHYPDANHWVMYPRGTRGACLLCLAGGLMLGPLQGQPNHFNSILPGHFDTDTMNKLLAVDAMRQGCWPFAFSRLGLNPCDIPLEELRQPPQGGNYQGFDQLRSQIEIQKDNVRTLRKAGF